MGWDAAWRDDCSSWLMPVSLSTAHQDASVLWLIVNNLYRPSRHVPGRSSGVACVIARNPLHTIPRNFSVDGEAANFYGLVVYVADLLQTCYGETGVRNLMDFGLISARADCNFAAQKSREMPDVPIITPFSSIFSTPPDCSPRVVRPFPGLPPPGCATGPPAELR